MSSRLKKFTPVSPGALLLAVFALLFIAVPHVAKADAIPPLPACEAVGNPASGLFVISATDDTDPSEMLQLFIIDTGSGTVFGPFPSGEAVKYTQSAQLPGMKARADMFFIFGQGPANLSAIDTSLNIGETACQP